MRILRLSLPALAIFATACRPDAAPLDPAAPGPVAPGNPTLTLRCTADVRRATLACEPASAEGAGPSRNLVMGGQGIYVALASLGTEYNAGMEQLTSNVTVRNLIPQLLGTSDGVTPTGTGVRVFFMAGPTTTSGSGTVSVVADGTDAFTASAQPYYEYAGKLLGADGMLAQNETSSPRTWTFAVPATVATFTFQVAVWTTVALPAGWITLSPSADSVAVGGHLLLTPTVRSAVGGRLARAVPWWSSSNTAVLQVDSATGQLLGVALGTATVTAHYEGAAGTATVKVHGGTAPQFISLSTYNQTCGLAPGGIAFCWGTNRYGELGTGAADSVASGTPQAVVGGHVFRQVVAGIESSCGLDTGGQIWCWGSNEYGQLGSVVSPESCQAPFKVVGCSPTPVPINTYERFTSISGESLGLQMCAIAVTGTAWCWGPNWYGQLGIGTRAATAVPVAPTRVAGGHTFTKVAVGSQRTCALEADGTPWCWGIHLQAYDGTPIACPNVPHDGTLCHTAPVPLKGNHKFRDIAIGSVSACGVDLDGVAWCWGTNLWAQMGTGGTSGTQTTAPVQVSTAVRFVSIDADAMHTCAVATDGRGYCWGSNQYGEIGDGTAFQRFVPRLVAGGHTWTRISAADLSTCGVATDGHAYCWGNGFEGRLGNGTSGNVNPTPLQVSPHP